MLVNLYLNLLLLLSITTGSVLALEQSANRSSSTINSSSVISTTTSDLQTYLCASSFRELQATHKTAQSCKSVPCPSGLFCFEYTVAITTIIIPQLMLVTKSSSNPPPPLPPTTQGSWHPIFTLLWKCKTTKITV